MRGGRGLDLTCALALCMRATMVAAQEAPADNASAITLPTTSPAPIPNDTELQVRGAHIGRIDIKVVDVFDPDNPKESGKLYRAANYLHINTRDATVRPQLLFKTGQPYSRHLLDETERNLRGRRYLNDAVIVPIHYDPQTNTVDLLVRVHDVWTLNPGASFGRSGGENHTGVQLDESNLLGWGKQISIDRDKDVDRSTYKFSYSDPNVLSSRWELQANYSNASDGGGRGIFIQHPFYSLDTRWSATFDSSQIERMDRRFAQNQQIDQYIVNARGAGAQVGWSTGVHQQDGGVPWIQRWWLGYRIDEQRYSPDPVLGTVDLPANLLLRYPFVMLSWFQDQYEVVRNRDQIDRTEDLYIGRAATVRVGYASPSWDADRNALILGLKLQDAYRLSERQYLFANIAIDGRHEHGAWHGTVFSAALRYDLRQTAKSMFVVNLKHAHLQNPDDSQQLFLGSDEGMRGYPLRYRTGTERTVLVLEQRVYTTKQILRLLSIGGAAFVDVGHLGGEIDPMPGGKHTFSDFGLGLRFGNIRSSRGDMFHFDVAYPLDAVGPDRKVQFSVITQHTF